MTPEIPFDAPPDHLELLEDEIQLFHVSLDLPPVRRRQLAETLSVDEHRRAAHFHFESDRNRFVAGRGLLREILGWLLHCPPEALIFSYGAQGKPRLAAPMGGQSLYFNLAHSDSFAVYAVSPISEVGVDLEHIRHIPEAGQIVEQIFSEHEVDRWRALPPDQQAEFFFECWTRKEAYLKAVGEGFSGLAKQIETSLVPNKQMEPLNLRESPPIARDWFSYSLCPTSDYICAVAARNPKLRVVNWSWRPCLLRSEQVNERKLRFDISEARHSAGPEAILQAT